MISWVFEYTVKSLSLLRKRLKDPFTFVGLVDGEWLGFANGRVWDKDVAVSLHTLTFSRRAKLGWPMYYAKTYYAMEMLKVKEWWSTFESYNGWRMAGLSMAQPTKPWPEYQHELGGAKDLLCEPGYVDWPIKRVLQTNHRR